MCRTEIPTFWRQRAALDLAALVDVPTEGDALVSQAQHEMQALRLRLATCDGRPVVIFRFSDGEHVEVYGSNSLFQGVLTSLGLRNGWPRPGSLWGSSRIDVEQLASLGDSTLLYFDPIPVVERATLQHGQLWRLLPSVRSGNTHELPSVWPNGGLPSAIRMANLICDALSPAPVL